jgi:hypothetical protein
MTTKGIICRWLSVGILLASFHFSAGATVVEYSNQTAYLSATTSVSTITFDGPANNSIVSYGNSSGYTSEGVNFIGYDNGAGPSSYDLRDENLTPYWGFGAFLDGPSSFGPSNNAGITVFLPANTYAVGTDLMALGQNPGTGQPESDAESFNIVLSTASTVYTVNSISGFSSMAFVGFTSDTAITSITFDPQSVDHIDLDNFDFGQTGGESSATPEAGTSLLCGSGLILLIQFLRRRSAPVAAV